MNFVQIILNLGGLIGGYIGKYGFKWGNADESLFDVVFTPSSLSKIMSPLVKQFQQKLEYRLKLQ